MHDGGGFEKKKQYGDKLLLGEVLIQKLVMMERDTMGVVEM